MWLEVTNKRGEKYAIPANTVEKYMNMVQERGLI
jgi:hypothetical protein